MEDIDGADGHNLSMVHDSKRIRRRRASGA